MSNNGHGGFTTHRMMELRNLTFKPADVVICKCGNEVEARPMMKGVCYSCYREQMEICHKTVSDVAPILNVLKEAVASACLYPAELARAVQISEKPTESEAQADEAKLIDGWLADEPNTKKLYCVGAIKHGWQVYEWHSGEKIEIHRYNRDAVRRATELQDEWSRSTARPDGMVDFTAEDWRDEQDTIASLRAGLGG